MSEYVVIQAPFAGLHDEQFRANFGHVWEKAVFRAEIARPHVRTRKTCLGTLHTGRFVWNRIGTVESSVRENSQISIIQLNPKIKPIASTNGIFATEFPSKIKQICEITYS